MEAFLHLCLHSEKSLCCSAKGLICGFTKGAHSNLSLFASEALKLHTHTVTTVHWVKMCTLAVGLIWCFGVNWADSGYSHGWFGQRRAENRCFPGGRSSLNPQYSACSLVHLRPREVYACGSSFPWQQHQFQIFTRVNSEETQRIIRVRFPGNILNGTFWSTPF